MLSHSYRLKSGGGPAEPGDGALTAQPWRPSYFATLAVGAVIPDEAGRVLLLRRNADDFMDGQ